MTKPPQDPFESTLPIEQLLVACYLSDDRNDGTYTLNLGHDATMALWFKVDRQTQLLGHALSLLELLCPNKDHETRAFVERARKEMR